MNNRETIPGSEKTKNPYEIKQLKDVLKLNAYPGRGIIIGQTHGGRAVLAYFIMGRSENSRNRVFVIAGDDVIINIFDKSKVKDPSLIVYTPVKTLSSPGKSEVIVTNGDQTDTIHKFLISGKTFEEALFTRVFEPDTPNFTPRISGMLDFSGGDFSYKLSIIKPADQGGVPVQRQFFCYSPVGGLGHFIHTYSKDGGVLPPFSGEPVRVGIPDSIETFASDIWGSLDGSNKISLYIRYINPGGIKYESRVFNKNIK